MKKITRRKNYLILLSLILLTTIFISITTVYAKGSSKGKDVWWYKNVEPGMGTWKATIYKTGNGIVHEWRYEWNGEPIRTHLIYKPIEMFPNQPQGKNWVRWTFDDRYDDLPGDDADLTDFFTRYNEYWVHFNQGAY